MSLLENECFWSKMMTKEYYDMRLRIVEDVHPQWENMLGSAIEFWEGR